jgi:hypothetical protein
MAALSHDTRHACLILFGTRTAATVSFLEALEPSTLKKAYRKLALVTHPDCVAIVDEAQRKRATDVFIQVNWAYNHLRDVLQTKEFGTKDLRLRRDIHKAPSRPVRNRPGTGFRHSHYYRGPIPNRPLQFGEYLYFGRIVPWHAFIGAIVWQRRQRPLFGEIARFWRYLAEDDVRRAIAERRPLERIGQTLIRIQSLRPSQVNTVLFYQRLKQKKIGEYFVEEGYSDRELIEKIFLDFKIHNSRYRRQ